MAPNEGHVDQPHFPANVTVVLPKSLDPPKETSDDDAIYRFWKVEDFFAGFTITDKIDNGSHASKPKADGMYACRDAVLGGIKAVQVAPEDHLTLNMTLADGSLLLVEAIRFDTIRIRWGPQKTTFSQYSQHLSRSLVMDTLSQLRKQICKDEGHTLDAIARADKQSFLWTIVRDTNEYMRVKIEYETASMEVWRKLKAVIAPDTIAVEDSEWKLVWSTVTNGTPGWSPLMSRKDGEGDYATCLSTVKRGKYIGFGEQGGLTLLKDGEMLNVYNYDNFAYSSVYGQQAVNPSEPLYHADPFGVEVGGVPGCQSAIGIFIDDYSQSLIDLGAVDPLMTRFGSRFGDLEVHVTCADDLAQVCRSHSSCVGRPKLFPRWVLGYHQGCYGYDTAEKVMECVKAYRGYGIPLDGMHIDVDLQRHYRTFTVDEDRFHDFADLLADLAKAGVKCSTNITPVISAVDDGGRHHWESGSEARSQYKVLDSGLREDVFVRDRRWNQLLKSPHYTYWEAGQERSVATEETCIDDQEEYRGGVCYGEGLSTMGFYPDFGRKDVRAWWGRQYEDLFNAGLAMVWQDMTTPAIMVGRGDMKTFPFRLLLSDDSESGRQQSKAVMTPALKINNLYSYNLHKATYQGVRRLDVRKGLRNFIIGRGSSTGHHRFAGLWTGDNTSSYEFLAISIQQVMSCGVGGTVITGADVGGFESNPFGSQWCDPQLLCRWTMANTLLPWCRNHYNGKPGHKLFQEPFAFAENAWRVPEQEALYRAVMPICRYYITLRYTFIQLLYDAMFAGLFDGRSIVKPMLATDSWDETLLDERSCFVSRQYMVADDILVSPVVGRYASGHTVYLPKGSSFYSFNLHLSCTQEAQGHSPPALKSDWRPLLPSVAGGSVVQYDSNIDRFASGDHAHLAYLLPIYIREGAIVPTHNAEPYIQSVEPTPLTIHFYPFHSRPNRRATYDMYIDDGLSLASAPSQLPQFSLDRDSGAQSDYRHIHLEHWQTYDGKSQQTTRCISIHLKHQGFDLTRTLSRIGSTITLYVWHDGEEADQARAADIRFDPRSDALSGLYDPSLNATVIALPMDDVLQRSAQLVTTRNRRSACKGRHVRFCP